ncbi:hypothetical protein H6F51_09355 [Cyanobacteria bacterium FACHB-DQ100]|nr:hypothetical protein [Cyanobacteria bacterium FACHB-DQ100]
MWYFTESPTGHLTAAYPIGTAIITFPFYVVFAVIRWIQHLTSDVFLQSSLYSFNIHSAIFEPDRLYFEKLAGTLTTSTAVVLFYLAARLKFNQTVCIILTFTYAFATQNWVTNSQSMLQHTGANLAVCGILLCFLKANRTQGKARKWLLFAAGVLSGLIPGIRPTDAIFLVAAVVYAVFIYRRDCVFLLFGLPSALLCISWNLYYFGTLFLGGYASQTRLYDFSIEPVTQASLGLLFSPARGLFTFSPVLLFMIPGAFQVFRFRAKRDEQLLLCFASAAVVLFINYCFFSVWWASWTYGNRFLADALPIFCLLVGYAIADIVELSATLGKRINYSLVCFLALLLFSTFVQCVGAFTTKFGSLDWNGIPVEIDVNTSAGVGRLWDWHDSPIERSARNLFHELTGLPQNPASSFSGLNGKIENVQVLNQAWEGRTVVGAPSNAALLQVDLQNTGATKWLGYDTGLKRGSIAVSAQFYDQENQVAKQGMLYIPGVTHPTQYARAIGVVELPVNYGAYQLKLSLVNTQTSESISKKQYELSVKIDPKYQVFEQEFIQVQVPKQIAAGNTAKLFTVVQTRSNFPWYREPRTKKFEVKHPFNASYHPVRFAYRWINESGEVTKGEQTPLPWTLIYRKDWTFGIFDQAGINTMIKAPDRPGNYTLRLSMFQEGVGWFDEKGAKPKDIPITVTAS